MSAILCGNLCAELINGIGTRIERVTLRQALTDGLRPQLPKALPRQVTLGRERKSAER